MFGNFYQNKNVLVTGATGFKGAWLCHWLEALGAKVTGLSIDIPTTPSLFEQTGLQSKQKHYFADIKDLEKTQEVFNQAKPDIVFHLAAQSLVLQSYSHPVETFSTNLMGTVNVMEAIRQSPSIHSAAVITTDKCYKNYGWNYGYRENDELGGNDPYSASKATCELAFRSYQESFFSTLQHLGVVTARAGNVIGGGDWSKNRLVPDCIRSWQSSKKVQLRNPESVRPWQHVLESLSGYLHIVSKIHDQNLKGESFNIGPGNDTFKTVRELADTLKSSWPGAKHEFAHVDSNAPKEAHLLTLSGDKIFQSLKWRPTLSFEEGVRLTGEWYLAVHNGDDPRKKTLEQLNFYCENAKTKGATWA